VPGSGSGAASATAVSKSVQRRRGARRDCDRVSKAEDVPEYKGSLPVEELLAFVEGSVPSSGTSRMPPADSKLRRTKRKEQLTVDAPLRNGDSKLVEVEVPVACLPSSQSLNGLLNGSLKHSEVLASGLSANFDGYVSSNHFPEKELLSSGLTSHLMANEDRNGSLTERKEKEFVLVQKKRRPKVSAVIDVDAESVKPLNGFCLSTNGIVNGIDDCKEELSYTNGFSMEDILATNGSSVSRNSSEGSLAQSFSSDINDLSHFVGEDGHSGGELYVDAPLCWNDADDDDDDDDDKDVSLSSFCSTMSSTESRQRLNSPFLPKAVSPDVDQSSVFADDRLLLQSKREPVDDISTSAEHVHLTDNCMTPAVQWLKTDSSTVSVLSSDCLLRHRCTRFCCTVPYKHSNHQTPVIFCDIASHQTVEDVSGVVFSFGCTMSDHLVADGLCTEAKSAADLPGTESKVNDANTKHLCSESPELPVVSASPSDNVVSFMYIDSIPERSSSRSPLCIEPQHNRMQRTCRAAANSNTDCCVDHFQVCDVQSYMYASKCY